MIIVELAGGLGNQMFQYAAGLRLAKHHRVPLKLDLTFLLDRTPREGHTFRDFDLNLFPVNEVVATDSELQRVNRGSTVLRRFIKRLMRKDILSVHESSIRSPHALLQLGDTVHLRGYWQNELFFRDIASHIRSIYATGSLITEEARHLADEIRSCNSICVNVRRGDFVANSFHGVCDLEYFQRAVQKIRETTVDPRFYLFSDDILWCDENMRPILPEITLVTHAYAGERFGSYLGLMSLCKHFVIPNSTFAWWAAWLSEHNDKVVIAPKSWFQDERANEQTQIVPECWLRL